MFNLLHISLKLYSLLILLYGTITVIEVLIVMVIVGGWKIIQRKHTRTLLWSDHEKTNLGG